MIHKRFVKEDRKIIRLNYLRDNNIIDHNYEIKMAKNHIVTCIQTFNTNSTGELTYIVYYPKGTEILLWINISGIVESDTFFFELPTETFKLLNVSEKGKIEILTDAMDALQDSARRKRIIESL